MKIRPQNAPGHSLTGIEHMVMIVPVDTDVYEAEDIAQKHRSDRRERVRLSPCGIFISSTMMVMMIAMTPSLNASSLFLPIGPPGNAANRLELLTGIASAPVSLRRPASGTAAQVWAAPQRQSSPRWTHLSIC